MFKILKRLNYFPTILWHDFYSSTEVAEQFLNNFDIYFSFGAQIFHSSKIEATRILLETDDQETYSIINISEISAAILRIEHEQLRRLLEENLKSYLGQFAINKHFI